MPIRSVVRSVTASLVALCVALPSAVLARANSRRWSAERVVDHARVTSAEISPDGSRIAYVVSRPRRPDEKPGPSHSNLWLVAFDGGAPRQMTSADAEDRAPAWSPDGSRLAFLSARGGEKPKTRVWVMPADGGEAAPVSDEKLDAAAFAWSPHSRSIALVAPDPKPEKKEEDEKEGRDWTVVDQDLPVRRVHVVTVAGPAAGQVRTVSSAGELSVWELSWAPDGSALAATVTDTPRTDDSYVLKRIVVLPAGLDGGPLRQLVGTVGKVDQIEWSPDGRTLAYRAGVDASDPYSGSLFVVPAAGGAPANLTGARPESVNRIAWLRDGRIAAVCVQGTKTALVAIDPRDPSRRQTLVEPGAEVFTAASFSADGRRFAVAASTADSPAEVSAADAKPRGASALRRLTRSNPDLDSLPRGKQEVVRYAARDGLEIEAVLIRPADYPGRASYPMVVVAHGGPESQYLDGWNTSYGAPGQALAERGCFVLYPNYRGSTGRGVAFAKADHRDLGGLELTDVLDGVDAAARLFPIDRKRVGIMGGSYGGYFTALAVTRHSDRFAAGVALFGITNWISFLGHTDIPRENSQVHWAFWCYDRMDACWQASPIAHVARAATPTLILQGADDPRVPKPQSDELYAALRWKGVPVEYVVYPREKHGFRERAHQLDTFTRTLDWFEKYFEL